MSNYFINNYKKNTQAGAKKESDFLPAAGAQSENEKVVKPFVFEKIERTPFPPKDVEKEGSGGDNKNEHLPHIGGSPETASPKSHTKIQLSAIFLIAVGLDKACEIMKNFERAEIEKITKQMLQITSISPEDIKAVEEQFGALPVDYLNSFGSAKEFVRKLLQKLWGLEEGSGHFVKLAEDVAKEGIQYLERLEPNQAIKLLATENDLVFASLLSLFSAATAAGIIKLLPRDRASSIIKTMSEKKSIQSDMLKMISAKLNQKAKVMFEDEQYRIEGTNRLVDIIKKTDSQTAECIIQKIEEQDVELAETLKESIFTFNDVVLMPKKSLEKVLLNYPNKDIAFLLKGALEHVKTIFLTCVTKRRQVLISEEMKHLGKVRKSDVDEKRREFVEYVRELEEQGHIILKEDDEIYVT